MTIERNTVSDYLIHRLKEHGVRHIFSVPGDFIGDFLDTLDTSPGIERVATVTELEAGYAADGYARTVGLSCIAVQYGVGTLSAINAVAGAARERVPMVVVTGAPGEAAREALLPFGVVFHHSTDSRMEADRRIFAEITAAAEVIRSPEGAAGTIDRVIATAIEKSAPVYLQIWKDVQSQPMPAPAARPPATPTKPALDALGAAVDAAFALIAAAKAPVLWAGLELQRYRLGYRLGALVASSGIPFATTIQAKGLALGDAPLCLGTYAGSASDPALSARMMGADVVVALGVMPIDYYKDLVTSHYACTIAAAGGRVRVGHAEFGGIALRDFLDALLARISGAPGFPRLADPVPPPQAPPAYPPEAQLTYESLFACLADTLDPRAVVCCDLGVGMFMGASMRLGREAGFIAQSDWASLGFAAPCALGVALAKGGPAVAICGDGSLQMIVQTLATHAQQRVDTTIIVLDNGIYALEQAFTGLGAYKRDVESGGYRADFDGYNILERWNYVELARSMGLADAERVETPVAFETAMRRPRTLGRPRLIQAVIDARDLPERIQALVESFKPRK